MANTKTSQEIAADQLTGPELVRIVQGGTSKRSTALLIANLFGRPKIIDVSVYSILPEDRGRTLVFTDDVGISLIVPFGLDLGRYDIVQFGDGLVVWAAAVGVNIYSNEGYIQTAGKYSLVSLRSVFQDTYIITGNGMSEGT